MSPSPGIVGSPRRGLVAATFGFFVGFAGVVVYGPAANEFEQAMGLSGIALGALVAAPNLFGGILRIPFGAWADDIGPTRPFLVVLALSATGMAGLSAILLVWSPEELTMRLYPLAFLFGALSGCGIAAFSTGSAQTSYWFPLDRQGAALAVFAGLGNSSPALFTVLVPVAIAVVGLRGTYLLWLAFLLVGIAIYAAIAVDPPYHQLRRADLPPELARSEAADGGQELFPREGVKSSIVDAGRRWRTWALVGLYFGSFGGFLALAVWFPAYWMFLHGVDPWRAGVVTAIGFILLATLVRIPGGLISDRIGGEPTAIGCFVAVALGATVLIVTREASIAVLGMVVLATGFGVANAAVFQLLPHYVPKAVGGASGLVGGLGAFGGFVVPPLLGWFVDVHGVEGYATGFLLYLAIAGGGIAIASGLFVTRDRATATLSY